MSESMEYYWGPAEDGVLQINSESHLFNIDPLKYSMFSGTTYSASSTLTMEKINSAVQRALDRGMQSYDYTLPVMSHSMYKAYQDAVVYGTGYMKVEAPNGSYEFFHKPKEENCPFYCTHCGIGT